MHIKIYEICKQYFLIFYNYTFFSFNFVLILIRIRSIVVSKQIKFYKVNFGRIKYCAIIEKLLSEIFHKRNITFPYLNIL